MLHGLASIKWRGIGSTDHQLFELREAKAVEREMAPKGIVEAVDVSGTPRMSGPGVSRHSASIPGMAALSHFLPSIGPSMQSQADDRFQDCALSNGMAG
jgi:hypothetical protein